MEQVIILDAKGQLVKKGVLIDRERMYLYKVGNDYMNCNSESVEVLQAECLEQYRKKVKEHAAEYMSSSTDLFPVKLAGFQNPYDEIHNLLKQSYNNLWAGQHLFCETVRQRAENMQLRKEKADLQRAKDLLCEFISSKGYKEDFERFCIGKVSQ